MLLPWSLILATLAQQGALAAYPAKRHYSTHDYYVLEHNPLAPSAASLRDVAQSLGVEVVEQAGELSGHWLVRVAKPTGDLEARGQAEDRVMARFEELKARAAAEEGSPLVRRSPDAQQARSVVSAVPFLERQVLRQREKRAPPPVRPPAGIEYAKSQALVEKFSIPDPLFTKQWHLANDEFPEHQMNVTAIWEMGYTGKGVITALVDDGLEYDSKDLHDNFDAEDSYNFNDHIPLPTPSNWDDHHGTRCAGQIAAVKNTHCGIGIAYDSKVAGLRILSGRISDVDEAAALNYGYQNTSIYSCSWGPPDNGRAMEGPNHLIKKAVLNGINNGRGGKGSVFVFASGNGAAHGDQCNFDGYTNSIYSVTVSAIDYKGLHPYYSEACAANMIVAYSSGSGNHIITTDKGEDACSMSHGGTSAAAPNAAGVIALALGARPDLTWRDIQYLCVETARIINADDPDWEKTAQGRLYSYKYGFGAIDGYAYVNAALGWQLVKPQAWLETPTIQVAGGTMNMLKNMTGGEFIKKGGVTSTISITKEMMADNNFDALEHINVKVWITHGKRGDVEVEVVSPNGIKSVLAGARTADMADTGFPAWTFMTVKHWGENPIGDWTIRVSDQASEQFNGSFLGWNMHLWGSSMDPSKAKQYDLPLVDWLLPPPQASPTHDEHPTSSKTHAKPTAHLPPDHGTAPGENSKPAFPSKPDTDTAETSSTPTPDQGWFSDMGGLVNSQKWLLAAVGAVACFGIGATVFFCRRRIARRRLAEYASVPDDVPMTGVRGAQGGAGGRTKELYDAFGEVSDDEDADEETKLTHGVGRSPGLRYHSGFLDDDAPSATDPPSRYRDEPETPAHGRRSVDSPSSPSGSGDGSWEHASQTR